MPRMETWLQMSKAAILRKIQSENINRIGWTGVFFTIVYQLWNATKVGTYWDFESDHNVALLNLTWLKSGVDVTDPYFQLVKPYGYALTYLMWVPAKIYYTLIGVDFNTASSGQNFLSYRNVFVYIVFLAGVCAIALWSRLLFRVRYSFILLFLLLSFPTVGGHALMNAKDVPIFSGVACALALSRTSTFKKQFWAKVMNIALVNLAIIFVLGVRPGAAYLIVAILMFQLWQSKDRRYFLRILLYGFPSVIYCYLVSATAKTYGVSWLWETMSSSTNFSAWQGTMFLWGKEFHTPVTSFYQFGVLLSQIPIFVFGFFLTTTFFGIFVKRPKFTLINLRRILIKPTSLPLFMLLIILLYVLMSSPMIYDDARQTLFIWAFLIPVVFSSMKYVFDAFKSKILFWSLLILVFLPAIDSFRLAPYTYTYRNEIAKFVSPNGFETDYWGLSGKESSKWILSNLSNDSVIVSNPLIVHKSFVPQPWKDLNSPQPSVFIYQQIRRPFGVPEMYKECKLLHTISRKPLVGERLVMGWVRECDFSQMINK